MGFLERLKGKDSAEVVDRAREQVAEHHEDIGTAIDRVAELADQATDGKHTERIEEAAAKLKEAADRLGEEHR